MLVVPARRGSDGVEEERAMSREGSGEGRSFYIHWTGKLCGPEVRAAKV
jgi:hypothetical protein